MTKKKHGEIELPPCGLYRTGRPLRSDPEEVPANRLVMFHNHSNRGIPFIQLPTHNENNTWYFSEYGPGIEEDDEFIEALEPLREQGIYFLREELHTHDRILPKYTIVQLGYTIEGDPIIFPGERMSRANAIQFPLVGYQYSDLSILEFLRPAYPMEPLDEEEEDEGAKPIAKELLN